MNDRQSLVILIVMLATSVVAGCSYLSAIGQDGSRLTVVNECQVALSQNAHIGGLDDADTVEKVTVHPDCTTDVEFRQTVGDSVVPIHNAPVSVQQQPNPPPQPNPATQPME